MRSAILHTARWVLPVSRGPVERGGVAVSRGRVVAVGKKGELARDCERIVDHGEGVIMPATVNCHCHLELSALAGDGARPERFADWLGWVVEERDGLAPSRVKQAAKAAVDRALAAGTGLVADVTNTGMTISLLGDSSLAALVFIERLGLFKSGEETRGMTLEGLNKSPANGIAIGLAAHAPYSTSAALINALKKEADGSGRLFSIHLAESEDEVRFLRDGTGPLRGLIAARGLPVERWLPPGKSPVEYAAGLGVLDERTVVVHAVELSHRDIEILAGTGARVVFCPRSNAALGLGRARISEILDAGIRAGLGTDSLASNQDLSIFGEMAFLAERFPEVEPRTIVEMATLGGAEVLAAKSELGSIEPGKLARLVFVPVERGGASVYEALVAGVDSKSIRWI